MTETKELEDTLKEVAEDMVREGEIKLSLQDRLVTKTKPALKNFWKVEKSFLQN